jgi:hypothetical protein
MMVDTLGQGSQSGVFITSEMSAISRTAAVALLWRARMPKSSATMKGRDVGLAESGIVLPASGFCATEFHKSASRISHSAFSAYANLLRKSQVAKLRVKTAMIAIGQVLFRISSGGMSFRNTPLVTTIIYRSGLA